LTSPDDRQYLESHEWHKRDGDHVFIGISQFAVDELTDITYVEVTADGNVTRDEPFGEIESVKATSDLSSGFDGQLVEVNQAVIDNPALINQDPYGEGWIIKIKPDDAGQPGALLTSSDYDAKAGQ